MTIPWAIDEKDMPEYSKAFTMRGFNDAKDAPISLQDMEREYCRLMNLPYPIKEMVFARSWMLFRVSKAYTNHHYFFLCYIESIY